MNYHWRRMAGGILSMATALVFLPGLSAGAATTYTWNTGSVTWDDATTANWSPTGVPANGDTVKLTAPSAGALSIAYGTTKFAGGTDALKGLYLGNTGGGTTTLTLADGQRLQYIAPFVISNGATFHQTGGMVTNTSTGWSTINMKGGVFRMTGGVFHTKGVGLFAWAASHGADIDISGGSLLLGGAATGSANSGGTWYSDYGASRLRLSGEGYINMRDLHIGDGYIDSKSGGGNHVWTIDGGMLRVNYDKCCLGNNAGVGSVVVTQNAGFVYVQLPAMYLNKSARYMLNGGTQEVASSAVRVSGEMRQKGGVLKVYGNLEVGCITNSGAVYFEGGDVTFGNALKIGTGGYSGTVHQAAGTLVRFSTSQGGEIDDYIGGVTGYGLYTLGDANGPATNSFYRHLLTRRFHVMPTGTLQGHGLFWVYSTLDNSGCVIADSHGSDGSLTLNIYYHPTSYPNGGLVTNVIGNTGNKGWFARNRGKLVIARSDGGTINIPGLTIPTGASVQNWGESSGDATIDLVNSARVTMNNVAGSGTLGVALLATDRTDLPALPAPCDKVISVHQFTPSGGISGYTCALTMRYDDAAVGGSSKENLLEMFHYNGSSWDRVTGSRDTSARTINSQSMPASAMTASGLFAIGTVPAGTIVMVR